MRASYIADLFEKSGFGLSSLRKLVTEQGLTMARENNTKRIDRLERLFGDLPNEENVSLFGNLGELQGSLTSVEAALNTMSELTDDRYTDLLDNLNEIVSKLCGQQEYPKNEITILRSAVDAPSSCGEGRSKVKVPEPQTFGDPCDVKQLQNFI